MEIKEQYVPLQADSDGVMRVGGTRVPLETVVSVFEQGATPEEVVQRLPALDLADVYKVIGYYLHHKGDIRRYIEQRDEAAASTRARIEAQTELGNIRERLEARKQAGER